jgi:hypothetical protein
MGDHDSYSDIFEFRVLIRYCLAAGYAYGRHSARASTAHIPLSLTSAA